MVGSDGFPGTTVNGCGVTCPLLLKYKSLGKGKNSYLGKGMCIYPSMRSYQLSPHWDGPERERLRQHGNARTRRIPQAEVVNWKCTG